MRLKLDAPLRRRLMVPESFSHPAKGHLGLWWEILERYTQPGDWILDPFAGIGSTLLAALLGRNVLCLELEEWMCPLLKANWEKMRRHGPLLGNTLGQSLLLRGDARALPLTAIDHIVCSPPYETSLTDRQVGPLAGADRRRYGRWQGTTLPYAAYRRPSAESGDPRYAPERQIGNLRGRNYWAAMAACYAEGWRVLKPGGALVLVIKGVTRAGRYVDLPEQTRKLVESLGFSFIEKWPRVLWSLSIWRVLQRKSGAWDERLRYEWVYAFRRP